MIILRPADVEATPQTPRPSGANVAGRASARGPRPQACVHPIRRNMGMPTSTPPPPPPHHIRVRIARGSRTYAAPPPAVARALNDVPAAAPPPPPPPRRQGGPEELCASERVLVVSTEPPDDLSCLTTPGVGRPGDGAVARAVDRVHPDAQHSESMPGFANSSTDLCALGCAPAGACS